MILVIDNFDSFTFNIVQMIQAMGEDVVVKRNNAVTLPDIATMMPDGIVISPGPKRPEDAGVSMEIIRIYYTRIPVLGVCLGHQCIASAFGGMVVHARTIMHGKLSTITHCGSGLFEGIPQGFKAVRYHSLAVDPISLPDVFKITALAEDGEIMGLAHKSCPLFGLQFHPESIATEYGKAIMARFIQITRRYYHEGDNRETYLR